MENKFKNILKISKAWETQETQLSKTFYGDIHKDSSWFFSINNLDEIETKKIENVSSVKKVEVLAAPKVENKSHLINPKFKLRALFIGDTQDDKSEDLLGKMISAMKLEAEEFVRVKFDEKLEDVTDVALNLNTPSQESQALFLEIKKHQPQIIITLGATVSNILLGRREKLSTIHGQFYTFESPVLNTGTYQFMPLFHPDYLKINPNMKKAAWVDLQKVMKLIGKI